MKKDTFEYDYGKALMLEGEKGKAYDIIFMDPPYNMGMEKHAAELIASSGLMADDGMLIVESAVHTNMDFLKRLVFQSSGKEIQNITVYICRKKFIRWL